MCIIAVVAFELLSFSSFAVNCGYMRISIGGIFNRVHNRHDYHLRVGPISIPVTPATTPSTVVIPTTPRGTVPPSLPPSQWAVSSNFQGCLNLDVFFGMQVWFTKFPLTIRNTIMRILYTIIRIQKSRYDDLSVVAGPFGSKG